MGGNYMYGKNLSKYLEALYQKNKIEEKLKEIKNETLDTLIKNFKESSGISQNLMEAINLKKTEKGISLLIENKEVSFEIKSNINEVFNEKKKQKLFDYDKHKIEEYPQINQNRNELLNEIKFFFMKESAEIEGDIQELIEEYLEKTYRPKESKNINNYITHL